MLTQNKNQDALYEVVPTMIGLQHEVNLLEEWFKKDYPESKLRVSCDFNSILFVLKVQIELLMGEEVAKNRLHYKPRPIVISERELKDERLMFAFVKEFNKNVRGQIQQVFNTHYLREKQIEEATETLV